MMKILLVGLGYRGYTETYERALRTLGHRVTTYVGLRQYDFATRVRRFAQVKLPNALGANRDYFWSEQHRFRQWSRRSKTTFDLALFVNSDQLATDEILGELSARGIQSGLWLLDDHGMSHRSALDLRSFDFLASFNPAEADALTASLSRPCDYVPQGFASVPEVAGRWSERPLILGAPYPSRRLAADALTSASIPIDLVGRMWRQWVEPSSNARLFGDVSLAESVRMSSMGRICVNGHRNADTGVSPRVFEIAGAGGLIITDNPRTYAFFEPNREMLSWSDQDELLAHVRRARTEPGFARRVASAGHRRVMAEHTIERRFQALLAGWGFA